MKKTIITLTLLAVIALSVFAQQYDPESDFRAEPMDGGRSVRITGYNGDKWTVRIPPRIREIPVTHIGDRAFRDNRNLISVTLPNSVTTIGQQAFSGCTNLNSVTIPNSVSSVGEQAFQGCANLSITWNYNPALTAENFKDYLKTVIIPDSVTIIGEGIFSGCTSLTSVTIENGVTVIGDTAFYNCTSLASVTIPNSVTSIRMGAFYGCTSLTSVTFQGTINSANFSISDPFNGDLRAKYIAGGIGRYTRPNGSSQTWTKQ